MSQAQTAHATRLRHLCGVVLLLCSCERAKTLLYVWISQTAAASRPKTTALHALHCTQRLRGVAARKAASRVFMRRGGLNFGAGKIQEAETAYLLESTQ